MFHAGGAHGVWDPTERSPAENRFASSARLPVLSTPPQESVTPVSSCAATALVRLHGFDPLSSPFIRCRYFTAGAAVAPRDSSPSRCSSFSPQRTPSRSLPLAYLRKNLSRRKASHLVPWSIKERKGWLVSERPPTFLGFPPSSLLISLWCSLSPGLWIHRQARGTSPPPDNLTLGFAGTDRSV